MKKIFLIILCLIGLNVKGLELNSKYAYVYNDTEDKAMYELNAKEEIKVASMTKIMTAIIIIENNPDLNKKVIIEDSDLRDMYEYTTTGIRVGDELTIKELLYGILLRSGADCVNAAVRVTSGTDSDFIDLMNHKVKELKLKNTYFSNPIGKDKDNYSSVHDIAKIMEYCLKNDVFKEIISTNMYYIDRLKLQINGPLYKQDTKYNLDLSLISGGKSGYTQLAKNSLVSYGEKDGIRYIVVTDYANNFKSLLLDNVKLYENYFNNYSYKDYKINFDIDIENGKEEKYNVDIKTKVFLSNDSDINKLSYKYEGKNTIKSLYKKGKKIGKIYIYYEKDLLKVLDVKLNKNIKYNKKTSKMPLFILLITIFIIIFVLIKCVFKIKNKQKKFKKIENNNKIEVKQIVGNEKTYEEKMKILSNTLNLKLFFSMLSDINNQDKEYLERNLIDRCFQNINFENEESLKKLYNSLKLYKEKMSDKTVKYYNSLFKYCLENYIKK